MQDTKDGGRGRRRRRVEALTEEEARLLARRVAVDGVPPAKAVRSRVPVLRGYSNKEAMADLMRHPDFKDEYKSLRSAVLLRHPDLPVKMADRLNEGLDAVDRHGRPDHYARQKWFAEGRATLTGQDADSGHAARINIQSLFNLILSAEAERQLPPTELSPQPEAEPQDAESPLPERADASEGS